MKQFESPTVNGGTTIILDSLAQAIETGKTKIDSIVDKYSGIDPKQKCKVGTSSRDTDRLGRKSIMTYGKLVGLYKANQSRYANCVNAITKGDQSLRDNVSRVVDELRDLVLDIAPMLRANFSGFCRAEDGFTALPELLACGDEMPCLRRKEGADTVMQGSGGGAYRVIISTDVAHTAHPADDAALIGSLITLLQQHKPVEVWIQQGWTGGGVVDGVTLFKLDFTGAFDPTQLLFWCGHEDKDSIFSYYINAGLGRCNTHSAKCAEIDCDLFLRGDLMKMAGVNEGAFITMPHTEKVGLMAKWIAATAVKIVFDNGNLSKGQ